MVNPGEPDGPGHTDQPRQGSRSLPIFPLGSVLFPTFGLPLHIFEPRYRAMLGHLGLDEWWDGLTVEQQQSDGPRPPLPPASFAVVLIERGSEVGGGDRRFEVGTVARVIDAVRLDDGRWAVQSIGVSRIRIVQWLPEDPFPNALVRDLDEPHGDRTGADLVARIDAAVRSLRRVLAAAAEAGMRTAPATIELDDDPTIRLWQACGLAPIGPLDDIGLLAASTLTDRVELLERHLEDAQVLLSNRLAGG